MLTLRTPDGALKALLAAPASHEDILRRAYDLDASAQISICLRSHGVWGLHAVGGPLVPVSARVRAIGTAQVADDELPGPYPSRLAALMEAAVLELWDQGWTLAPEPVVRDERP